MTLILMYGADILVTIASLGAMAYCMVLSRRLSRLTSFDKGLGGAIAVMSSQVDEMKNALREAKAGSDGAGNQLGDLVLQARDISAELEMMIAACHDFAEEAISVQAPSVEEALETEIHDEDAEAAEPDTPEEVEAAPPETSVTPMFGSRRALNTDQVEDEDPPKATVEPLFRRRRTAG
jgi:hypothetical protein